MLDSEVAFVLVLGCCGFFVWCCFIEVFCLFFFGGGGIDLGFFFLCFLYIDSQTCELRSVQPQY